MIRPLSFLVLLAVLAACRPSPEPLPPPPPPLPPTLVPQPTPTATAPLVPQAVELGVLGKGVPLALDWSPDGETLAILSTDGIYLHDTQTWQVAEKLPAKRFERKRFEYMMYAPDGAGLILWEGRSDPYWRLDLGSGELQPWLESASFEPLILPVFAPDGQTFAVTSHVTQTKETGGVVYLRQLELRRSTGGWLLRALDAGEDLPEGRKPALAFHPQGTQLAVAGRDHRIQVWDTHSGQRLYSVEHDSDVTRVAYTPDGRYLFSASLDATLRFWDSQSGAHVHTLQGFTNGLLYAAYLPAGSQRDGRLLVGEYGSNVFREFRLDAAGLPGEPLAIEMGVGVDNWASDAWQIHIEPQSRRMAALRDGEVQIWDLEGGQREQILPEYTDYLSHVVVSPDQRWLAAAGQDVYLWDLATQTWVVRLFGESIGYVHSLAFHPDSQQLVVASDEARLVVWDVGTLQKLHEFPLPCEAQDVIYAPDGKKLAAAGDCSLQVLDAKTGQTLGEFQSVQRPGMNSGRIGFSADSQNVFRFAFNGRWGWEIASGKKIYGVDLSLEGDFSPFDLNAQRGVVGSEDATGTFWDFFDPASGQFLYSLDASHKGWPILSSDGKLLAYHASDQTVVQDAISGEVLFSLAPKYEHPHVLAVQAGRALLVTSSYRQTLHVWDISSVLKLQEARPEQTATPAPSATPDPTHTPVAILPLNIPVRSVPALPGALNPANIAQMEQQAVVGLGRAITAAWAPDGKTFAVGSGPGVYVFGREDRQPVQFLPTTEGVQHLAFTPDGRWLAGRLSNTITEVWEVASGRLRYRLENPICRHNSMGLNALRFSPDGKVLIADCGLDRYRWDMERGELLQQETLAGFEALSPDGHWQVLMNAPVTYLVEAQSGKIVKAFDVPGLEPAVVQFSPDSSSLLVWFRGTGNIMAFTRPEPKTLLQVWEIQAGAAPRLRTTLEAGGWQDESPASSNMAVFSADSRYVFTASGDGQVEIWEAGSGKRLAALPAADRVYLAPDDGRFLTLGVKVQMWELAPGGEPALLAEIPGFTAAVRALAITGDGQKLLSAADWAKAFYGWEKGAAGFSVQPAWIQTPEEYAMPFGLSPDGRWLAAGTGKNVYLGEWNPADPHWQRLEGAVGPYFPYLPFGLAFSPDSSLLAVNGAREILVWELGHPLEAQTSLGAASQGLASQLVFSPDGRLLLGVFTGILDMHYRATGGTLLLWDVHTGKMLRQWYASGNHFLFHPNGVSLVATTEMSGIIQMQDVRSGKVLWEVQGAPVVFDKVLSPDGRLLVVAARDVLQIWDMSTGKLLREIDGDYSQAVFSPDGTQLILARSDGRIEVWGLAEL